MATRFDNRQSRQRSVLDQLSNSTDLRLDNILNLINDEITMPLRMRATATPNLILNIDSIVVETVDGAEGHGRKRTIPPISNLLPNFTGATITFPSSSGGSITTSGTFSGGPYTLTVSPGNWIKVMVSLTGTGDFILTFGTEGASESAAGLPGSSSGSFAIGYVAMQNIGGTIQNVTNTRIYQFVGGGGGSGSGNGNEMLETIKNMMVDSTYDLVTPVVAMTDQGDLISSFTAASFDMVSSSYKFDAASSQIESVNLADSEEFLNKYKDISKVQIAAFWREGSIDNAATYAVSRGLGFYPVTMSRVGETEAYVGEYEWTREDYSTSTLSQAVTSTVTEATNLAGTREAFGQKITFTNTYSGNRVTSVKVYLSKVGSPTGNFYIKVMQDAAGFPSLTGQIAGSAAIAASSLTTSAAQYELLLDQTLDAGDYHIVVETDDTYKSGYVASTHAIRVHSDGSGTPAASKYDAGVWSADSIGKLAHLVSYNVEGSASLAVYNTANNTGGLGIQGTGGSDRQRIGQKFTLANPSVIKDVAFELRKTGSPLGYVYFQIVKDNAGFPSTAAADVLTETAPIQLSGVSVGNTYMVVKVPKVAVPSGDYHLVMRASDTYLAGYTASPASFIAWGADFTSPPTPNANKYTVSGGWAIEGSTSTMGYAVSGYELDLTVRITSSMAAYLDGFAVFYDPQLSGGMSSGVKRVKRFDFLTTANTNTFTLDFVPDPDLLQVHYIQKGQVFKSPAFQIDGKNLVFPANTFYNGGISDNVTLIASQAEGVSFDNADKNAALLAGNFLGSTDASVDRSAAGRGIFLRRPDGTLREIALDNNDNLVVYSV